MKIKIIILTYNSEKTILNQIQNLKKLSSHIYVVDSYSTDSTVQILKKINIPFYQRKFDTYSRQRNWAQKKICTENDWVFHIDSDEILSEQLIQEIKVLQKKNKCAGFLIQRKSYFQNKPIRHGYTNPSFHLRLFKSSNGFCEDRLYDQHFIVKGTLKYLQFPLLDFQNESWDEWKLKHKKWAKNEALEYLSNNNNNNQVKPLRNGNIIEKKRSNKKLYYSFPILLRPFLLFIYSFFFKKGFLDHPFIWKYHVYHALLFRLYVDIAIIKVKIEQMHK